MEWVTVKVHPSAKKDVLVMVGPGRFEAWVRATPREGHANETVTQLLAKTLQIPLQQVRLVKGRSGRHKLFKVQRPSAT